ncbi:MAG: mechanosensitive ion channel [Deltaproteobacteria bacterium]|nr:mechanosensitive ion channel [Deltaproteobacteria bacterium]
MKAWATVVLLALVTSGALAQPEEPEAVEAEEVPEETTPDPLDRIRAALEAIGGFEHVTVSEQAGVIQLQGEVARPSARQAAQQVAERAAPNALFVANGIEVVAPAEDAEEDESLAVDDTDSDIEGSLRRILSGIPELATLRLDVDGGIVHLRGTTKDEESLERAIVLIREREGVIYVDAEVEVKTSISEQIQGAFADLKTKAKRMVGKLPVAGIGVLLFLIALFISRKVARSKVGSRVFGETPLMRQVVARLLGTLIMIGGILLALDIMGATGAVGAVLGTAGIVGLAVGFAFKDIVENYLAGILLAFHRPFAAGDFIEVGGTSGKVIRLAARETILMTLEGNHVQIPNSQVFKSSTTNYTRNPKRRLDFVVGIGTGEELARAQTLGVDALAKMKGTMDDPVPFAWVEGFGDSSMSVHYFAWVDQREFDFFKVKSEAIRQVKRALDEAGVDLPNPILDIDVFNEQGRRAKHLEKAKAAEPEAPPQDLSVDREIDKQIADDPEAQKPDLLDANAES